MKNNKWISDKICIWAFPYDDWLNKKTNKKLTVYDFTKIITDKQPFLKPIYYAHLSTKDLKDIEHILKKGFFNWLRWKTIDLSVLKFQSRVSKAKIQLVIFAINTKCREKTDNNIFKVFTAPTGV